ncbi:MAG: FGGY-family carbohydrate kinase [Chloroflexota bacterium]
MLLGIDLGTGALKVGLFTADGQPLAIVRRSFTTRRIAEHGAEQDPDEWWAATCDALAEIFATHDPQEVAAICVIGQGPTLVVCDVALRARAPALLWADRRDHAERLRLSEQFGSEVSTYSLLPKVSWLARGGGSATPPPTEIFSDGAFVMQAYDFIAARLTGQPFASQFGAWPPFAADEFARADLNPQWIPNIVPMGQHVGVTRAPWCDAAHLPAGIPIIAGVYDSVPTTLGTALVVEGRACDFGGGSGGFGLVCNAPFTAHGIGAWPGLCEGQFIVGGATASAGTTLDWFARTFGGLDLTPRSSLFSGEGDVFADAEHISVGADGLIFLPYLAGARAPLWDDELRGAFVGLALHHRLAHLARAVCEGIAFGLRNIARVVEGAGGRMTELRVCGGTARYELLNQIKADVLGVPVLVPQVIEASLLGAAMIGAVGMGLHADHATAAERMVHVARRLETSAERHAKYHAVFEKFLRLTALKLM